MKKFTDEQLSRILSGRAGRQLGEPLDWFNDCSTGCINQLAYNNSGISSAVHENVDAAIAYDTMRFNSGYRLPDVDGFLRWLEKEGLA